MTAKTTARDRNLRKQSTDAEQALSRLLRNRQLANCKFRRQVPLGNYIVDFLCFESSLVIEIDGGQHRFIAEADAERTAWLQSQGFRVIRFWNNELLAEPYAVLEAILSELEAKESPSP
jgi:adenine-specific DNA-methyltransferase